MADLKTIFVIMLMINIGAMLFFASGIIDDNPELISVGNEAKNRLGDFASQEGTDFSSRTLVNFSSPMSELSGIANPITAESGSSANVIFKMDNPFAMILNLLTMVLGTIVFGLIYVLWTAQAPAFIIWLVGVPLTLIYMISGLMFIRSGN